MKRDDEARDLVRRMHVAIALDAMNKSSRARLGVLPEIGSAATSQLMARLSAHFLSS